MHRICALLLILFSPTAFAGIMEISYSYSQSESNINDDNFQQTSSHTGSFSWYFFAMSAIELSYTKGEGKIKATPQGEESVYYRMQIELYGADLVLTFAQKDSVFQPYIKGGAVWVDKRLYRLKSSVSDQETLVNSTDKDDAVPSMGAGFKFYLLKQISLKASYDTWRSGKSGDEETWDEAIRAGISFIF